MDNLYASEIRGKLYQLIFELNKNNRITINTSVGPTKHFETGENVTQGSVGGGLISSNNLAVPTDRFFSSSLQEIFYGRVRLQPLIYQDYLAHMADSVESAQAGIEKIETCMETKVLDLHQDKSCFMLVGRKDLVKDLRKKWKKIL